MSFLAQELVDDLTTRDQLIGSAIVVGVGIIVYWLASIAGRRYVGRMSGKGHERAARAETMWTVLRRVIFLVVLITVVLFVFTVWGLSLTPFLGVGTVLAAALGFGAQDLVKDFLSGFFILVEDQFHVGDVVTIADTTGVVEDIQLRVTLLRDLEGNQHYVPNGQIKVTSNFTSLYAQPVIDVGIAYEADVDVALEVFRDELQLLASDPGFSHLITAPPEILGVDELGDSAVILRARLTTSADERWMVKREAFRRIKKRFDAEGIPIPFPQVTINRKGGEN